MTRILVVLPNWFGETLFVTPFLRALRQHQPDAFLATVGWPQCREVLQHNPRVNEMLDYDERGRHRGLAGKWRLIRLLGTRRFDLAFILRRSLSRTCLLALAGIPKRVGFANAKSGWLLTDRVAPPRQPMHKASTYLPLLEAVGAPVAAGPYEYWVGEDERQEARDLLRPQPGDPGGPLVVLHPGANWPHKRWPPERFAALGRRLAASHKARLAVTGGPDDVPLARAVAQEMRAPAMLLAGRTTLRQLGACLEQAALVVSNDTGVLHVAAAVGRPVVALYGPTAPALTGPLGDPQRTVVLHHPGCCPAIPCYQPDHPAYPGMDAITVDEAVEAASRLLSTHACASS